MLWYTVISGINENEKIAFCYLLIFFFVNILDQLFCNTHLYTQVVFFNDQISFMISLCVILKIYIIFIFHGVCFVGACIFHLSVYFSWECNKDIFAILIYVRKVIGFCSGGVTLSTLQLVIGQGNEVKGQVHCSDEKERNIICVKVMAGNIKTDLFFIVH